MTPTATPDAPRVRHRPSCRPDEATATSCMCAAADSHAAHDDAMADAYEARQEARD